MAGNVITSAEALGGIPTGDYYNDGTDLWIMTATGLQRLTDIGSSEFTEPTLTDPVIESSGTSQTLTDSTTRIIDVDTTSAATAAGTLTTVEINQTTTANSDVNSVEALRAVLTTEKRVGVWANAILGKIDFGTAGNVWGLAGAICAELDLPVTPPGNGHYTCFEAELNIPDGAGMGALTSFMTMNVWGADVATFQSSGYILEITGLSTAGTGKVFSANNNAADHALRIKIDGVDYWILLANASD